MLDLVSSLNATLTTSAASIELCFEDLPMSSMSAHVQTTVSLRISDKQMCVYCEYVLQYKDNCQTIMLAFQHSTTQLSLSLGDAIDYR